MQYAGADPGFQVRGGGGERFKKLRRAEGGAKMFGVFRVKNHDFIPTNHIPPPRSAPDMDYSPLLSAFIMKTKNIRITSIQICIKKTNNFEGNRYFSSPNVKIHW